MDVAVTTINAEGTGNIPGTLHAPDCAGTCGGWFLCASCGGVYGWCGGCHDDLPDFCDGCWERWSAKEAR